MALATFVRCAAFTTMSMSAISPATATGASASPEDQAADRERELRGEANDPWFGDGPDDREDLVGRAGDIVDDANVANAQPVLPSPSAAQPRDSAAAGLASRAQA